MQYFFNTSSACYNKLSSPISTTCDAAACGDEMRYTMTGKAYFKLPPITAHLKGIRPLDSNSLKDDFTSEDDDEILANLAGSKKSSDISSTTSSVSCLPPTPPTSESRPLTPTGSTTVDSDIYEYCSAKEDSPVIVQLRPKLLLTQHKRKRGRPFGSVKTAKLLAAQSQQMSLYSTRRPQSDPAYSDRAASSSFGYSSDDNSSRGTLDLIIPPPKDFQGINNPFLSQICDPQADQQQQPNKIGKTKKGGGPFGTSQIRLVRTVKRRLSARDIVIGPNMEVKRRKIRRSSGHFEVISTSTIVQTIGGSKPHLPVRTDFKDLALSTGAINSSSTAGLSPPPPPPPPPPPQSVFRPEEAYGIGGRRLRKRSDTNYSETRRSSGNAVPMPGTNTPNGSSSTLNQIPGAGLSPAKGGVEASLTELQSSLTVYFGAANRIANGERFSIQGRRVGVDGRNQFLIEWHTIT